MCRQSEEALALLSQQGDEEAFNRLLTALTPFVRARVHGYFLLGADSEDAMQEGMIGLFRAIRDYNPNRGSLRSFADLCIRRQMVDAVRHASRKKHDPLNHSVSLEQPVSAEQPDSSLQDWLKAPPDTDPEQALLHQEHFSRLSAAVQHLLSPYERQVLELFLAGMRYSEIARRLDKPEKSVDNALQRIRAKIAAQLNSGE